MTSRGEVGLIVATVGLSAGLIGADVFASVVLMVLATTLLTPIMLRVLYPKTTGRPEPLEAPGGYRPSDNLFDRNRGFSRFLPTPDRLKPRLQHKSQNLFLKDYSPGMLL